ncbi:MAG: 4-hydroxybenzoate octaprenyltransferase [Cellvibrionaceae bacterium]
MTNNTKPSVPLDSKPSRFMSFWQLMRLDKPIGTLLLLWPTLWALWIAGEGKPDVKIVMIFVVGTIVMRAAGCVINDYADRNIDGHVARTRNRPLATGAVSATEALILFVVLCAIAFGLVLFTNPLTIKLSLGGVALAICYPFMKRFTFLPQVVLGAAFSWGIPMAFTAQTNELSTSLWLIYIANLIWTVVYDTFYAMVDRKDDLKIGVKSTAILFGSNDRMITGVLQAMTILSLVMVATRFNLGVYFYGGLVAASLLFWYQQWLIKYRDPQDCFRAFLNNQWVGCVIFLGILLHYY